MGLKQSLDIVKIGRLAMQHQPVLKDKTRRTVESMTTLIKNSKRAKSIKHPNSDDSAAIKIKNSPPKKAKKSSVKKLPKELNLSPDLILDAFNLDLKDTKNGENSQFITDVYLESLCQSIKSNLSQEVPKYLVFLDLEGTGFPDENGPSKITEIGLYSVTTDDFVRNSLITQLNAKNM